MKHKQPASRHCFICGRENPVGLKMDFYFVAPGQVLSELIIPAAYQGYPGMVHGGIIAAVLADGRSWMTPPALW